MRVPFLDLAAHHQPLRNEFMAAIQEVIDSSAFAGGQFVAQFERDFADFNGTTEAIGVGNGTDALWFSLLALGVKPGDEVITVPHTFIATAEAISFCGAKPVFVDIDERSYTMNPDLLENAITNKTKAIIPVHIFGHPADMNPILEIAARHGVPVIEDACQAHGAKYKGRTVGTLGQAGCYSFYPGKNLGAFGEAGAVITNDAALAENVRILRDHGQAQKYHHSMLGWNGRMDGIQAAVLRVKLRRLENSNAKRRQLAAYYQKLLLEVPEVVTPWTAEYALPVYHIYAVRIRNRDRVYEMLSRNGIGCGIHYPIPLHLQKAYEFLNYPKGSFPVAECCSEEFLSLPMYPELTLEQVQVVVEELKSCLTKFS